MSKRMEMRRKIQKSQNALREKKRKEREEKLANRITKSPFHRKHGDKAEKKRISQLSHLSDKEKKNKIKNLNVPDSKKKTVSSRSGSAFVTKNGKRYLKTSTMGKKIIADQRRKSLASKNYMSKEMIEKRKKRLKIKK